MINIVSDSSRADDIPETFYVNEIAEFASPMK